MPKIINLLKTDNFNNDIINSQHLFFKLENSGSLQIETIISTTGTALAPTSE